MKHNIYSIALIHPINQVHALMHRHFAKSGTYFPVNGASEIPLAVIPTIEAMGGKALVKANVTDIIIEKVRYSYII